MPSAPSRHQSKTQNRKSKIAFSRRLLLESGFRPRSLFLTRSALAGLSDAVAALPASAPVYVASRELLCKVVGYNLHRGCLAAAGMAIHRLEPVLAAMRIHENQNFLAGGQLRYRLSTIGVQARALREVDGPVLDHAYFAARIGFQAVRSVLPDSFMANRRLGPPVRLAPRHDPKAHAAG